MRDYTCPTCDKKLTTMQAVRNHQCASEPVKGSETTNASEGNTKNRKLGGLLAEGVKEFMTGASRGLASNSENQAQSSRTGPVEDKRAFPADETEETSGETQETRKQDSKGKSTSAKGMSPLERGSPEENTAETSEETQGPNLSDLTQRERSAFAELERCNGDITDELLADRVGYANRSGAWKVRQKWEEQRS